MEVYVRGKKVRLDPATSIGQGGEADVYDVGSGLALKLFKPPDHPDFAADPLAQQAAADRLEEHQQKLRAFPASVPDRVVVPQDLVTDKTGGRVVGYTMRRLQSAEVLFRYGERTFRQAVWNTDVFGLFRDLHGTVDSMHRHGIVIGDFNDLNVLVAGSEAHLIDADSMQFGAFLCRVFTERFVDPLLCDPAATHLMLARPHGVQSDWYAFSVMLLRSLLFVEPYGGVYRPGPKAAAIGPGVRPLKRITIFHPDVRYPKPAERWDVLPDDLLQYFHSVFVKDRRQAFPLELLESARWTRCTGCGREHARSLCPYCTGAPPAAVREVTQVRGEVTARRIFATTGTIFEAAYQAGRLLWLYQDGDTVKREDGQGVFKGRVGPGLRFRFIPLRIVVGGGRQIVVLDGVTPGAPRPVEIMNGTGVFDTNERHLYRIYQGQLTRDGALGPERIGDVLPGQTMIWAGPTFGFGFYRAGGLQVAFVFDADHGGLNDSVALPRMAGQLTSAQCVFGTDRCFFLTASEENGRTIHRCTMVMRDGTVVAGAAAVAGDGSWLGTLGRGCVAGRALLMPTDEWIVRVEQNGASLVKTREYPDTEPFVDAGSRLVAGDDGLYVVDEHEIRKLTLARVA